MFPNNVDIVNRKVENGRAVIELALPVCSETQGYMEVFLWEENGLLAFYCAYPSDEDDNCVISLINPHLWKGLDNPYLYRLEVYAPELIYSGPLAVYSLEKISQKGYFLNGSPFMPKAVYYDSVRDVQGKGDWIFWEGLKRRLEALTQMGANMLVLGSASAMSMQERLDLEQYCNGVGLLLYIEDVAANKFELQEDCDSCVMGGELFDEKGVPTDVYYRCKSMWSKEEFVYISLGSLAKQTEGGYKMKVYTNCKKVTLMVNDKVFCVQEGTGELLFTDLQIKGFPVNFTAQAGACSMSVRCYGICGKFS